jgi:hypothetical protein
MLALESPPPDAEMGGPELCNMRQHRSPPVQGGAVVGHAATSEPT